MRRTSQPFARLASVALAAAALGACADLRRARLDPEPINVESPAAGVVMAAEKQTPPFPSFRDVPRAPTDVRPAAYASSVAYLNGERAGYRQWEAENPPILSGTQDFATATRGGVPASAAGEALPADQRQRSADWAKKVRDAAKAPEPPSRPGSP